MQGPAEGRLGSATRLLFSQVAYLVHDNLDVLMLGTVLVGPCVRVELACEEDFVSLPEEISRDDLLVVVELLLEDDAAEEAHLRVGHAFLCSASYRQGQNFNHAHKLLSPRNNGFARKSNTMSLST